MTGGRSEIAARVGQTARMAGDLGLSVLPPLEDGSKAPLADWFDKDGRKIWKPAQIEPAGRDRIEQWYSNGRTGVGLVCGAVSGGLELFEFDDRGTYEAYWETAVALGLGDLVERIEAGYLEDTPGGGVHWFYYCDEVRSSTKLAQRLEPTPDNPHKVKTLIETKGEGGYAVIAPSGGTVHPTGGAYRLLQGDLGRIVTITSAERDALWNLARSFDESPVASEPEPALTPTRSNGRPRGGADPGERPGEDFNRQGSWEEVLVGWKFLGSRGDTQYLRRPGKDHGISASIRNGRLNVYSTSTPFESVLGTRKTYDKFGAIALLKHGGDLKAAARALGQAGFGSPPGGNFVNSVNSAARACATRVARTRAAELTELTKFGVGSEGEREREESSPCIEILPNWADPILEEAPGSEPFPLKVFPTPVADLVCHAADSLTCPRDFVAAVALVVASGAIGRSVAIRLKDGWIESACLYLTLVGEPGMTKSPAISEATRPLWGIARSLLAEHAVEMDRHRLEGGKGVGPRPRRLVVEDTTVEALAPILRDNPRGVVMVRDELSALFAGHNQYKGGKGADRQFYLSNWSGSPISVDRKHNPDGVPIHIPHPFLSIVGGMTPGMLSELAEGKGRDDGFLDRILFSRPDEVPVRWRDQGIPDADRAEWDQVVRRLWQQPMVWDGDRPRPFFMRLSKPGQALFAEWFDAHAIETEHEDFPHHLKGPWAKFRGYCGRLALILDRLTRACDPEPPNDGGEIRLRSVEAAISLIDYFKSHARGVRGLMRGVHADNPDGRALLSWIVRGDRAEFSEREARRNFPTRFPLDGPELTNAIRWLELRKCVRPSPPPEKRVGRPGSPTYSVNPALLPGEG